MSETLLQLQGLTKAYPGVIANQDVAFDIGKSEIHALLGENGAGKSTLVKMIYGLVRPDSGQMRLFESPYAPDEPRAARAAGVAMVFQHFSLFEALNVAENIALGMENPPKSNALSARIKEVSEAYGLPLDPERLVGDLSAGERQRVEIIRCLLQDPKLLIMDEPTSVLTPQEVQTLFATLRKLKEEGTSILYISHKLEEIRDLCETATILRAGRKIATCDPREKSARELAEMMVGGTLNSAKPQQGTLGDVVLEVADLSLEPQTNFGISLKNISFSLRKGEILGIGGVAGNGQDELLACLSGEVLGAPEQIRLNRLGIGHLAPNARRSLGVLAAPEERLGHAAAPDMSLTENAMLTGMVRKDLSRSGFLDWPGARAFAEEVIETFDVRTPNAQSAARSLVGW
jgi:simple sugar transport system ATP-binding protein